MARPTLVPDPWLADLLSHVAAENQGLYVAGGWIRDWLLGRVGRDIDLCVATGAIRLG